MEHSGFPSLAQRIADKGRHLSLHQRFLIAPLLGLIMLGVLLAAFIYESQRQNALLTDIAEHHLKAFGRYTEVFIDLSARHVALYELLTATADFDTADRHARAQEHLHAINAAIAEIEAALGSADGERKAASPPQQDDLASLTAAYRRTVTGAVETKAAHLALAPAQIALANARFAAMNRTLSRLLNQRRQELSSEVGAGVERNSKMGVLFSAIGISGAVLLLFFSFALSRILSRALRAQIEVLAELGDAAGTDRRRDGGDEIQRIGRAIEVFKHTQRKLHESEQRFRFLFEHNNVVMLLVDPDSGVIENANTAAAEFYGYARQDLCAMKMHEINPLPPDEVAAERENALRERRNYSVFPHLLADGRLRIVEVHATPIEVAGKFLLFSIMHDITERKMAEEELRLLNQDLERRIAERTLALWNEKSLLRSLVDAIPDVITVKDVQGRYLACNAAFARSIAGVNENAVLGKRARDLIPAAEAADFEKLELSVMASGFAHKEERWLRFADDRSVLLELIQAPLYDYDNMIIGTIGIGHDITVRNQREEKLREARQAADAANLAKSSFLAAISHEIRTPLHGIVGMIELLGETARSGKQRRMLETARGSAFTLLRIIDDILDFSKIEAGKLTMERVPVSIREIVERVADTLAPIALKAGVRLMLLCDPALPPALLGDQVRLSQILFNLANNAIKFSHGENAAPGDVMLRVERRAADGAAPQLRISVRDNGIGMAPELVARLFRPFTQADNSTTRRYGGTGLGLTICKRLVDQMGGEIRVESAPGAGSLFTVDLPLAEAAPGAATAEAPPEIKGLRVLAVVAAPQTREAVAAYLEAAGVETRFCADLDALETTACDGHHFDLLLLGRDENIERDLPRLFERHPEWARVKRILLRPSLDSGMQADGPDALAIRCCPLLPSVLLHAVARSAGRHGDALEELREGAGRARAPLPSAAQAEADGRLVLVAEDNEVSRDVIRQQLNLFGYAVETAADGGAALDLWRQKSFALLLTDCHMPEMDGFQLTQAIRHEEAHSGGHLPIVAITANAMRGEAKRCIDAGMDDFLSKPFELKDLERRLARWLPHSDGAPTATGKVGPRMAPQGDAPIDLKVLTKLVGDDPGIQARLLDTFLTTSETLLAELRAARSDGRLADVAAAAHRLKSSCRSIGSAAPGSVCAALEAAGRAGDAIAVDAQIEPLTGLMHTVFDYVRSMHTA